MHKLKYKLMKKDGLGSRKRRCESVVSDKKAKMEVAYCAVTVQRTDLLHH